MHGFICRLKSGSRRVPGCRQLWSYAQRRLVLSIQMLDVLRFCFSWRGGNELSVDCVFCLLVCNPTLQQVGPFRSVTWPWYFLVHRPPAGLCSGHSSFPDPASILGWEKSSSAWEKGWSWVPFTESSPQLRFSASWLAESMIKMT